MSKSKQISKQSDVMTKLLATKDVSMRNIIPGELIEGIVVSMNHNEILVDVGAKSEGVVTSSELADSDDSYRNLKPGDPILVKVLQVENDLGYIVLSLKRAEKEKKWTDIDKAYSDGSVIEATVLEYNKGGLLCDVYGSLRGFIPLSHLDRVHFSSDVAKFAAGSESELKNSLRILAGKVLKVKVIEVDKEKNRLVLSEKDAVSSYSNEARGKRLLQIEPGSTLKGIVTGIMPFGVFVDLEGIEGLVHISEIAWEKVNHPSSYFSVGQEIDVLVMGIDNDTKKLALSVKRLTPNPWETVESKYPVGTKVKGQVTKIVPFGAFITLEKGLDGLLHVSEAAGPVNEGETVEAKVIQVDGPNQKLALSTRQLDA